ncbi:MAG: tetratricopeptide repeat protein, partial [Anaerolineae bacterium]
MARVWSSDVQARTAEWSRSQKMLKQAVWRYPDQYGRAVRSLCPPKAGRQTDRAFGARIACLHGWVHQFEVILATIEQIPEAFRFYALYELPSPRRCIKHESLPTTALIEPKDWKQGKQDRLALFEARKALLRSDTKRALAIAREVSARDIRLPLQSIRAEAAEIRARASLIQRDFKRARILYDEVIRIADAESDDRMRARAILGQLRVHTTHRNRPDEALALLRQYESLFESVDMPFWKGKFFYEYALAFASLRQEEKALPWAQKSLAVFRRILPGHDREVLDAIHVTGQYLTVVGQRAEGEKMHREGLEICIKHLGPGHAKVAAFELALAFDAQHQRKHAEAVKRYRRALRIYLEANKRSLPSIAQARGMLCSALCSNKQHREAVSVCRQAVAENGRVYGQHNPVMAYHQALLGSALSERGRHREAREILERALILAQARPDSAVDTAFVRIELALVLKRLRQDRKREVSLVKKALPV